MPENYANITLQIADNVYVQTKYQILSHSSLVKKKRKTCLQDSQQLGMVQMQSKTP